MLQSANRPQELVLYDFLAGPINRRQRKDHQP
jgi:hypothetical protein